jgi:antitoxin component YwqK of YwqJK toxin-antitoxin module
MLEAGNDRFKSSDQQNQQMKIAFIFILIISLYGCASKTEVITTYANGSVKLIIDHTDKYHYAKKTYYQNGHLEQVKFFTYGLQDSVQYDFNESGEKIGEMGFHYGDRNGLTHEFYPSGQVAFEGKCVNGKFEGLSTWYFPNGKIRYIGFRHLDRDTGRWETYDSVGLLKKEAHYFGIRDSALYYDGKGKEITHDQWENIH